MRDNISWNLEQHTVSLIYWTNIMTAGRYARVRKAETNRQIEEKVKETDRGDERIETVRWWIGKKQKNEINEDKDRRKKRKKERKKEIKKEREKEKKKEREQKINWKWKEEKKKDKKKER